MTEIQLFDNGDLPGRVSRDSFGGYVYVIEFTTGIVKVGRTNNPRQRLSQHYDDARIHGASLARHWLSPLHLNYADNETELISYGRRNSASTMRNEYFAGLAFAGTVEFAEALTFEPVTSEAVTLIKEHGEARLKALKRAIFGPEPSSSTDYLAQCLDRLFGRRSDGSYLVPESLEQEDEESMSQVLQQLADATGRTVEEILALSWLDLHTETLQTAVATASLRLRAYALENGLEHLIVPMSLNRQDSLFAIGEIA